MTIYNFFTDCKFSWNDIAYEVTRVHADGRINIEAALSGEVMTVEVSRLVDALFLGTLYFDRARGSDNSPRKHYHYVTIDDCPIELQLTARYRLWVITPLLEMGKKNRTRTAVEARVGEVKQALQQKTLPIPITYADGRKTIRTSVSAMSIYRWLNDYEQSGGDIRALIPNSKKQGGHGKLYIADEAQTTVNAVINEMCLKREKATIDDVYAETVLRIDEENRLRETAIQAPSRRTVARRIERLDLKEKFAARHGKRAARHEFSQFKQTEYPDRPMGRVEIDHTRLDVIVVDDEDDLPLGRPTLTSSFDTTTRYPTGYYLGFEPPSYLSVMECLYHGIRPKGDVRTMYGTDHSWLVYGLPANLVIDNGKEFVGRDLEDACLQLGIILQQTPVKMPHFKSAVERFFGTTNTGVLHTLPGTTFSNVLQRGDYNSLRAAVLTLHDLDKIIHIFLLDYYAERFHKGLEGIPARRWEAHLKDGFMPRLPPNLDELQILLGRVEFRTVQPYGIELFSLRYNCRDLTLLRIHLKGEKAKIKYHPGDLSRIYAYDPVDNLYLEVPALDQEYAHNLSLWKHRVIRSFVLKEQDTVDIKALAQAKRKIQKIVNEAKARSKTASRSKIARWETNGRPAAQVTTPVPQLEEAPPSPAGAVQPASIPDVDLNFEFDPAELEKEGWGAAPALPNTPEDTPDE